MNRHAFRWVSTFVVATTFVLLQSASDSAPAVAAEPNCPSITTAPPLPLPLARGWEQPPFPPAGNNDPETFHRWAWLQFLALNWPNEPAVRGVPDKSKTLADTSAPRVWETWMTTEESFRPLGAIPNPWTDPIPPGPRNLMQHGKLHDHLRRETEIDEAVGGMLLDQNCYFVRFDVAINRVMFDRIRSRKWYNALEQLASQEPIEFPNGSIEIKPAWKVLVTDLNRPVDPAFRDTNDLHDRDKNCTGAKFKDDPRRYITTQATIYGAWDSITGQGKDPITVTVGLVGMHVVTKDPGRPQRIWATFEQVDNVCIFPEYKKRNPTLQPSFYDPAKPNTGNASPNLRIKYQTEPESPRPVQVTREKKISDLLQRRNAGIRTWLADRFPGAPWQYYQLVGVQWPTSPNIPRDGKPSPKVLANTVIETFNQTGSSCLGCHSFARPINKSQLADFSWIMGHANWPKRQMPAKPTAEELFAYVTQLAPFAQEGGRFAPGGRLFKTWGSFPDSGWNTYSGFMEGENPHGNWTRIYINDKALAHAKRYPPVGTGTKRLPFPPGSIVLKENHMTFMPDTLVEYTIMLKREKGYNPPGNDWFWLKVSPNGKVWRRGKADGCITCHGQKRNGDFMLTWNYGDEPYVHNYATRKPLWRRPTLKE